MQEKGKAWQKARGDRVVTGDMTVDRGELQSQNRPHGWSGPKHRLSPLVSALSLQRPDSRASQSGGLQPLHISIRDGDSALLLDPHAVLHPDYVARVSGSLWHGFHRVKTPLTLNPAGP